MFSLKIGAGSLILCYRCSAALPGALTVSCARGAPFPPDIASQNAHNPFTGGDGDEEVTAGAHECCLCHHNYEIESKHVFFEFA
jgi:hypothetical protein